MKKITLFPVLLFLLNSCSKQENSPLNNRLIENLKQSNRLIEKQNNRLYLQTQQIYYLRCKSADNLKQKIEPAFKHCREFLATLKKISRQNALTLQDIQKIHDLYHSVLQKLKSFSAAQKIWSDNDYQFIQNDYSTLLKKYSDIVLLRIENDMLINQSLLIDYLLFYSICLRKESNFLTIESAFQKGVNTYRFMIYSIVPWGKDFYTYQMQIDSSFINKKKISLKYSVNFRNNDKALGELKLDTKQTGNYQIFGKLVIIRKKMINNQQVGQQKMIIPFETKLLLNR